MDRATKAQEKTKHFQPTITTQIQLPLQLPLKSLYIRKGVMQSTVTILFYFKIWFFSVQISFLDNFDMLMLKINF